MTVLLTTAAVCAQAQSKPEPYFSFRELPNMLKWAPAPPDTMGAAFTYDIMQYMWGKEMRQNKERADIAIRDAVYSLECIAQEFSEPFGLTISEENTPEIWKLSATRRPPARTSADSPSITISANARSCASRNPRRRPSSNPSYAGTSLTPPATPSSAGLLPCCSRRSIPSVPTPFWPVA